MQEASETIQKTLQDKLVAPVKAHFEAIKEENRQIMKFNRKLMIWLCIVSSIALINLSISIYLLLK